MRTILLAVFLTGCGADFTGTWSGSLSDKTACSDSSTVRRGGVYAWTILDKGETIEINPVGGDCGLIDGRSTGLLTVRLAQKDCPDFTSNGYRYAWELRSGTLEMDSSRGFFGVTMEFGYVARNSAGLYVGTCDSEVTGRMTIER